MNAVRLRLSTKTTTIFVQEGWLVIEVASKDELEGQLLQAAGERMLTVAEVSMRAGFFRGAVRAWIKRSKLTAVKIGKEYRVREADLERVLKLQSADAIHAAKPSGRRRKGGVRLMIAAMVDQAAAAIARRNGLAVRIFASSGHAIPNHLRPSSNVLASR
jgi:excisionase family DNA binding protein